MWALFLEWVSRCAQVPVDLAAWRRVKGGGRDALNGVWEGGQKQRPGGSFSAAFTRIHSYCWLQVSIEREQTLITPATDVEHMPLALALGYLCSRLVASGMLNLYLDASPKLQALFHTTPALRPAEMTINVWITGPVIASFPRPKRP